MPSGKICSDCEFFIGEMFRSIGPFTGYCDNEKSPYYRKDVANDSPACEDFKEASE